MRIFRVHIDDSTQRLDTRDDAAERLFNERFGEGKTVDVACVVPLQRMTTKKGIPQKRSLSDATVYLAKLNVLLVSDAVKSTLEVECAVSGQWIPVDFPEKAYWLLNLTHVIDALDMEHSEFFRFGDGRIGYIDQFAFRPEMVAEEWIFKVEACPYDILCTERFVSLVDERRWTGFFFKLVWDSSHAPFPLRADREYVRSRPDIYGPEGVAPGFDWFWPQEWRDKAQELGRKGRRASKS